MLLPGENLHEFKPKLLQICRGAIQKCLKKDSDISKRNIEYFVVFCVFLAMTRWQAACTLMNLRCFFVQQLLLKTT